MRTIKFRAWNKEMGEMERQYDFEVGDFDDKARWFEIVFETDERTHDVMQYTGLKDKNGKEIYQNDILKFINPEGETFYEGIAIVKPAVCGFSFDTIPELSFEDQLQKGYDSTMFWHEIDEDVEVIGNIYEDKQYENDGLDMQSDDEEVARDL